jgi:hypothetical protein
VRETHEGREKEKTITLQQRQGAGPGSRDIKIRSWRNITTDHNEREKIDDQRAKFFPAPVRVSRMVHRLLQGISRNLLRVHPLVGLDGHAPGTRGSVFAQLS